MRKPEAKSLEHSRHGSIVYIHTNEYRVCTQHSPYSCCRHCTGLCHFKASVYLASKIMTAWVELERNEPDLDMDIQIHKEQKLIIGHTKFSLLFLQVVGISCIGKIMDGSLSQWIH